MVNNFEVGDKLLCLSSFQDNHKTISYIKDEIYEVICWPSDGRLVLSCNELGKGGFYISTIISDYSNNFKPYNESNKYMRYFKDYFEKHKELIITLSVVFLLDHYVFEGAFRNRLKALMDNLIGKAEKQLNKDN